MILDGTALDLLLHGIVSDPCAYLERFGYTPPPLDVVSDAPALSAEVYQGVWVARCDCGARGVPAPGGVVWLALPLVWCPRCEGDGWRRVRLPDEAARPAIEAALLRRPELVTRNWRPSETVADLARENREHGIEEAA